MRTLPRVFSAPMIRALLAGRKTQTRRVLRNCGALPEFRGPRGCEDDPDCWGWEHGDTGEHIGIAPATDGGHDMFYSGRYAIGDRLWVREMWSGRHEFSETPPSQRESFFTPDGPYFREDVWFWADGNPEHGDWERPRPSIHMPRWASRLTLTVTDVRVERLQDITPYDAECEGIVSKANPYGIGWIDPTQDFADLWDSINAKRGYGWDTNPWVVALTFTVHRCNVDKLTEIKR